MKRVFPILFVLLTACAVSKGPTTEKKEEVSASKSFPGFFGFSWDEKKGKVLLEIEKFDEEFLYVNYLAAGVGSNDIGLDRGQIGDSRIVKFVRSGPKVLLVQPNYGFRAISNNENEVRSVDEAFAESVLWGFKIEKEEGDKVKVDLTPFLLSDSHGISARLKRQKQGSFNLDASRSAIYLPMTKNFSDNTEFESTLTFKGQASGRNIRSVTPTPNAVTVRTHHSFVRLPKLDYEKRKYDPRSGFYSMSYQDYATPIEEPLVKQFIYRHRLEKKDPNAEISEPVEPIVYYVDKGAPEPVRSALIEGAQWWNQAFEKAGYKDAFQVYVLPDSADPLDINYNVIQWVHRSTRGWSYGSWIADPRTGEILKGHVSLGSLRIRQDFLIATGLLMPYDEGTEVSEKMREMALDRLRQLSAHEVGHTLGLFHNFAASVNDRASVMDYPHPYIQLTEDRRIDISEAYDQKIGKWDEFAIRYGYSDFAENDEENLMKVIDEWIESGYNFIMDSDARPKSGAHADAHLWDNGKNAAKELQRIIEVRKVALANFSERAIAEGEPISTMEEVLVPMYFIHRFQIEAASKLIGGLNYSYKTKGDQLNLPTRVRGDLQEQAVNALLSTISADFLLIPDHILKMLPPKPPGFGRTRESFKSKTGVAFDPVTAAETAAEMSINMLLQPERLERIVQQSFQNQNLPGWNWVFGELMEATWRADYSTGLKKEIKMVVEKRILYGLMNLSMNSKATEMVKALAFEEINKLSRYLKIMDTRDAMVRAHYKHAVYQVTQFLENPEKFAIPEALNPPDGSPIGMGCGL